MGGKSAPKPPDFGPLAQMSKESAELQAQVAREQLAWGREMWNEQKGIIDQIIATQLPEMEAAYQNARTDRERYERFAFPLQEEYYEKAANWNSPEERARIERENARRIQEAKADVAAQYEAQRKNALQRLSAYGVNRAADEALDTQVRLEQAKTASLAANQQRAIGEQRLEQREREGMGYAGEALNVSRGLASQGLGYAAQGLATSNAAGAQGQGWQGAMNAMGSPTQWSQLANNSIGTSGSLLSAQSTADLGAFQAEQAYNPFNMLLSAGAQAAGMGAGYRLMRAEGGEVRGPGGPTDDAVPAQLSNNEYVIPANVVLRKGTEFFDKLVNKVNEEDAQRQQTAQTTPNGSAIPPQGMEYAQAQQKQGNVQAAQGGQISANQHMPPPAIPPRPMMAEGGTFEVTLDPFNQGTDVVNGGGDAFFVNSSGDLEDFGVPTATFSSVDWTFDPNLTLEQNAINRERAIRAGIEANEETYNNIFAGLPQGADTQFFGSNERDPVEFMSLNDILRNNAPDIPSPPALYENQTPVIHGVPTARQYERDFVSASYDPNSLVFGQHPRLMDRPVTHPALRDTWRKPGQMTPGQKGYITGSGLNLKTGEQYVAPPPAPIGAIPENS